MKRGAEVAGGGGTPMQMKFEFARRPAITVLQMVREKLHGFEWRQRARAEKRARRQARRRER